MVTYVDKVIYSIVNHTSLALGVIPSPLVTSG